ncbi:MAG TPA: hypothetical protein VK968_19530 [Roseimicrobium sp.]|nr:hypothetical protein [Roseimicrobium sp.]
MKFHLSAFNIYLLCALMCLPMGCASSSKKKKGKERAILRIHLQAQLQTSALANSTPISVYREKPVLIDVENDPVIFEVHIEKVEVIDEMGAFSIRVTLNRQGTWLLQNITAQRRNSHMAILGVYKDIRWLGAPYIDRTITDGIITFTPDATRAEADEFVKRLNETLKEVKDKL